MLFDIYATYQRAMQQSILTNTKVQCTTLLSGHATSSSQVYYMEAEQHIAKHTDSISTASV